MSQTPVSRSTLSHRFFLKSIPVAGSTSSEKYTGRYLRYTGSGHAGTVLTEASPVFFSFHIDETGRLLASSSRAGDEERVWGFVIAGEPAQETRRNAAPLEVYEGPGTTGFYFEKMEDGAAQSVLKWKSPAERGTTEEAWKGWLVRDSPPDMFKGNPQLFWRFQGRSFDDNTELAEIGNEDGAGWVDLVIEELR